MPMDSRLRGNDGRERTEGPSPPRYPWISAPETLPTGGAQFVAEIGMGYLYQSLGAYALRGARQARDAVLGHHVVDEGAGYRHHLPSGNIGTMRDTLPARAVDGITVIDLPPGER